MDGGDAAYGRRYRRAALLTALVGVAASSAVFARDPEKTIGTGKCGTCHKSEVEAWKLTHHFNTFDAMPQSDKAKEIAGKLGIKNIKTDSLCMTCHFTTQMREGVATATVGVSCESCHGGAKDWVKIHGDYGGAGVTRETEDAGHKATRLADSEAGGMLRPAHLYDVAANCFQCHTVPQESLVNVGGHTAGSDFELVSWSQGEVRHNYVESAGKENRPASAERKRVMYVIGRMLDMEFGLRGVARSTTAGPYAKSMARRVLSAEEKLKEIHTAAAIPEIQEILGALPRKPDGTLKLTLTDQAEAGAAADVVSAAARKFAEGCDGSGISPVDALIPGAEKYHGKARP